jgi:hypothetical protein
MEGIFTQKLQTTGAFGFLGLIAMDILFFFSTAFWRRKVLQHFPLLPHPGLSSSPSASSSHATDSPLGACCGGNIRT